VLNRWLIFGLVVTFTILHLLYAWAGGLYLYKQSGGVNTEGKWERFGGAPYAWTIPIQLPGTLILEAGSGGLGDGGLGPPGLFTLLAGSVATSYAMASVLLALLRRKGLVLGRFGWKAALIVLGLIWIPVPEQFALVYQYTVRY
jgi:hypothetical protein